MTGLVLVDCICFLAGLTPLTFALVTRRRFNTFWSLWCLIAFALFWLLLIPITL
jgi:hypothetical protein